MGQDWIPNRKGKVAKALRLFIYINNLSPNLCRPFLRSRSQSKPRRNLRSRYENMIESIRPRSDRPGSSDCGSFTTRRRTRSSSITSPTFPTNPTTPYQASDHGRLGRKFSILKPTTSRSQVQDGSLPKILALPSWLQDTIAELDGSHPLRAVFPTLRNDSDPTVADGFDGNLSDFQTPRHGVTQSLCLPPTPRSRTPPRTRLPYSDTSSDELQTLSARYSLYHDDSMLCLQSGPPTPSIDTFCHPEVAFPTTSIPSASINVTGTPHICGFEATSLSASSLNHNLHDTVSPAAQRDDECDGVFRYDPSQADLTTPSKPFVFERLTGVYFDSPIEDPINSDPLEPSDCDHDPFKLDPEEYKNLGFKWAPFTPQTGLRRDPMSSEPETSAKPLGAGEVIASGNQSSHDWSNPHWLP